MKGGRRFVVIAVATVAVGVAVCCAWWVYNRYFSERANPSVAEYLSLIHISEPTRL